MCEKNVSDIVTDLFRVCFEDSLANLTQTSVMTSLFSHSLLKECATSRQFCRERFCFQSITLFHKDNNKAALNIGEQTNKCDLFLCLLRKLV